MDCREFDEWIVNCRTLESPEAQPVIEHAAGCRRCAPLLEFLKQCPNVGADKMTDAESAQILGSIEAEIGRERPRRTISLLQAAAAFLVLLAAGLFFYLYRPATDTAPSIGVRENVEKVEKVELYVHKTGEPESQATYLYLEVHRKEKR
jgi:hypothetical protein